MLPQQFMKPLILKKFALASLESSQIVLYYFIIQNLFAFGARILQAPQSKENSKRSCNIIMFENCRSAV